MPFSFKLPSKSFTFDMDPAAASLISAVISVYTTDVCAALCLIVKACQYHLHFFGWWE